MSDVMTAVLAVLVLCVLVGICCAIANLWDWLVNDRS